MTFALRPQRVLAIARRDLAVEMKGRRGWALPLQFALLLVPLSTIPVRDQQIIRAADVAVRGDVPPEVAAAEGVVVTEDRGIVLGRDDQGRVTAKAAHVPEPLRRVLDGDDPAAVALENVFPAFRIPRRTLLLALVTASVLVGAVSESLPGERARRTLEALLTAGITRMELVTGKWLAWSSLGALVVSSAAAIAWALDRVDAGWWALPMLTVPACTVALGLFLVRRAPDVVGGATVTVRVVPAMLGASGILAWLVGTQSPWLGAAVPLGGALLASGEAWDGVGPAVLSAGVTTLSAAAMLFATARDLDQDPIGRERVPGPVREGLIWGVGSVLAWGLCVAGPELWALAGNPRIASELPVGPGAAAAALAVGLIALVREANVVGADPDALWRGTDVRRAAQALGVGLLVAAITPAGGVWAPDYPMLAAMRARFAGAMSPEDPLIFAGVVLAVGAWFHGGLVRRLGAWPAAGIAALALSPLDPVGGALSMGLIAGVVSRTRTVTSAWVALAVGWGLGGLSPLPATVAAALGAAALLAQFAFDVAGVKRRTV